MKFRLWVKRKKKLKSNGRGRERGCGAWGDRAGMLKLVPN